MDKTNVLFLCTGNSARSQMAEALLRRHAGHRFNSHSAGLEPRPIHPHARTVMAEIGEDLAGQHARSVRDYPGKMLIEHLGVVCANAEKQCPTVFPMVGSRHFWPLEDPAAFEGSPEEELDKFREVRDEVDRRIREWLADLGVEVRDQQ